jgi:prolipoprotein diacylglyceryltransferase
MPTTLIKAAGRGILAAIAFVIATWVVADTSSGPLLVENPDGGLAQARLLAAVVFTVIGGIIGTGIAYVLRNRERGDLRFLNICLGFLIVYGAWAFNQAEDITTGIWLNVMHLAAAAPIIDQLRRWMRAQ